MDEVTKVDQVATIVACIKLLDVYQDVSVLLDLETLQSCIDATDSTSDTNQFLIFTAIRDFVTALRAAF